MNDSIKFHPRVDSIVRKKSSVLIDVNQHGPVLLAQFDVSSYHLLFLPIFFFFFFLRNPLISCDNCFFLNCFFFRRPVGKNCDDLIVASIVSTWPPCCLSPKSGDPHEHTQDFHPRNCRDFISPLQCFTFTSTGQKVRIFKGCTAINCLLHR